MKQLQLQNTKHNTKQSAKERERTLTHFLICHSQFPINREDVWFFGSARGDINGKLAKEKLFLPTALGAVSSKHTVFWYNLHSTAKYWSFGLWGWPQAWLRATVGTDSYPIILCSTQSRTQSAVTGSVYRSFTFHFSFNQGYFMHACTHHLMTVTSLEYKCIPQMRVWCHLKHIKSCVQCCCSASTADFCLCSRILPSPLSPAAPTPSTPSVSAPESIQGEEMKGKSQWAIGVLHMQLWIRPQVIMR